MKLEEVVPWGRCFEEYRSMFRLSDDDLEMRILGCADGPASFNAEAAARGLKVTSCDPLYEFSVNAIRRRIDQVCLEIIAKVKQRSDDYIWDSFSDVEQLRRVRMSAMAGFLSHFDAGCREGRYVPAALPSLPFANGEFDLVLCSHYLFLYTDQVDGATHLASIQELCRVATEVRVFPLVSLDGTLSKHLQPVMTALSAAGIEVSLQPISYRFQIGATEMLVAKV